MSLSALYYNQIELILLLQKTHAASEVFLEGFVSHHVRRTNGQAADTFHNVAETFKH